MARVHLVRGTVQITEGKSKRIAAFEGTAPGDTPEEMQSNFQYWRTLYKNDKLRAKMKELEHEGHIVIVSFEVVKELGLSAGGLQFKNNPYI
jgi:hypothetical protein